MRYERLTECTLRARRAFPSQSLFFLRHIQPRSAGVPTFAGALAGPVSRTVFTGGLSSSV